VRSPIAILSGHPVKVQSNSASHCRQTAEEGEQAGYDDDDDSLSVLTAADGDDYDAQRGGQQHDNANDYDNDET
jgi:hypothetical protein